MIGSKNSVLRSISTILMGCVLLFVPGLTMKTVIIVIGSILILSGLVTLLISNLKRSKPLNGFLSFQGLFNILFGIIFISSPSMMIKIFMFVVGVILLIMGLLQLAGSISALTRSVWAWFFLVIGLLTTGSGIYLLTNPYKSAETILPFLGGLLLLNGISELFRNNGKRQQPPKYGETSVEDIPYEEV